MERQDNISEKSTLSDEDMERYYTELWDEIDKAKQPIIDKISPDLYFEYHLFRLQLDGYYILWVDISKEKKEIYIKAYHRESHKRLYAAIAMDGHIISVEEVEKMAADTDIIRCPRCWENSCKDIIDNMHLDGAYELIHLPEELSDIKKKSDEMWESYAALCWGDDGKEHITMKATDIIELMLFGSFREESRLSSDRPVALTVCNTYEIKGKDTLQGIFADAIDIICKNGGRVIINDMGLHVEGYSVLRKRIKQYKIRGDHYEERFLVHVNPYGTL